MEEGSGEPAATADSTRILLIPALGSKAAGPAPARAGLHDGLKVLQIGPYFSLNMKHKHKISPNVNVKLCKGCKKILLGKNSGWHCKACTNRNKNEAEEITIDCDDDQVEKDSDKVPDVPEPSHDSNKCQSEACNDSAKYPTEPCNNSHMDVEFTQDPTDKQYVCLRCHKRFPIRLMVKVHNCPKKHVCIGVKCARSQNDSVALSEPSMGIWSNNVTVSEPAKETDTIALDDSLETLEDTVPSPEHHDPEMPEPLHYEEEAEETSQSLSLQYEDEPKVPNPSPFLSHLDEFVDEPQNDDEPKICVIENVSHCSEAYFHSSQDITIGADKRIGNNQNQDVLNAGHETNGNVHVHNLDAVENIDINKYYDLIIDNTIDQTTVRSTLKREQTNLDTVENVNINHDYDLIIDNDNTSSIAVRSTNVEGALHTTETKQNIERARVEESDVPLGVDCTYSSDDDNCSDNELVHCFICDNAFPDQDMLWEHSNKEHPLSQVIDQSVTLNIDKDTTSQTQVIDHESLRRETNHQSVSVSHETTQQAEPTGYSSDSEDYETWGRPRRPVSPGAEANVPKLFDNNYRKKNCQLSNLSGTNHVIPNRNRNSDLKDVTSLHNVDLLTEENYNKEPQHQQAEEDEIMTAQDLDTDLISALEETTVPIIDVGGLIMVPSSSEMQTSQTIIQSDVQSEHSIHKKAYNTFKLSCNTCNQTFRKPQVYKLHTQSCMKVWSRPTPSVPSVPTKQNCSIDVDKHQAKTNEYKRYKSSEYQANKNKVSIISENVNVNGATNSDNELELISIEKCKLQNQRGLLTSETFDLEDSLKVTYVFKSSAKPNCDTSDKLQTGRVSESSKLLHTNSMVAMQAICEEKPESNVLDTQVLKGKPNFSQFGPNTLKEKDPGNFTTRQQLNSDQKTRKKTNSVSSKVLDIQVYCEDEPKPNEKDLDSYRTQKWLNSESDNVLHTRVHKRQYAESSKDTRVYREDDAMTPCKPKPLKEEDLGDMSFEDFHKFLLNDDDEPTPINEDQQYDDDEVTKSVDGSNFFDLKSNFNEKDPFMNTLKNNIFIRSTLSESTDKHLEKCMETDKHLDRCMETDQHLDRCMETYQHLDRCMEKAHLIPTSSGPNADSDADSKQHDTHTDLDHTDYHKVLESDELDLFSKSQQKLKKGKQNMNSREKPINISDFYRVWDKTVYCSMVETVYNVKVDVEKPIADGMIYIRPDDPYSDIIIHEHDSKLKSSSNVKYRSRNEQYKAEFEQALKDIRNTESNNTTDSRPTSPSKNITSWPGLRAGSHQIPDLANKKSNVKTGSKVKSRSRHEPYEMAEFERDWEDFSESNDKPDSRKTCPSKYIIRWPVEQQDLSEIPECKRKFFTKKYDSNSARPKIIRKPRPNAQLAKYSQQSTSEVYDFEVNWDDIGTKQSDKSDTGPTCKPKAIRPDKKYQMCNNQQTKKKVSNKKQRRVSNVTEMERPLCPMEPCNVNDLEFDDLEDYMNNKESASISVTDLVSQFKGQKCTLTSSQKQELFEILGFENDSNIDSEIVRTKVDSGLKFPQPISVPTLPTPSVPIKTECLNRSQDHSNNHSDSSTDTASETRELELNTNSESENKPKQTDDNIIENIKDEPYDVTDNMEPLLAPDMCMELDPSVRVKTPPQSPAPRRSAHSRKRRGFVFHPALRRRRLLYAAGQRPTAGRLPFGRRPSATGRARRMRMTRVQCQQMHQLTLEAVVPLVQCDSPLFSMSSHTVPLRASALHSRATATANVYKSYIRDYIARTRNTRRSLSSKNTAPAPAPVAIPPITYRCDVCEQQFTCRLQLNTHVRRHRHVCVCRETFTNKQDLIEHSMQHRRSLLHILGITDADADGPSNETDTQMSPQNKRRSNEAATQAAPPSDARARCRCERDHVSLELCSQPPEYVDRYLDHAI